jgi:uncharacterized protein
VTLNLKALLNGEKSRLPFEYTLDLSELDFFGDRPYKTGACVTGEVYMLGGMPFLKYSLEAELDTLCASCGKPARRRISFSEERALSDNPEDAEKDDVSIYANNALELNEIVTDAALLQTDMRILCRDDCKGLCARCGADLNEGGCRCEKESDPRMSKLKELL